MIFRADAKESNENFVLGDLWSYNSELNTFVVSPEPDVKVIPVDVKSHRCLIFGTDGLWNMLSPQAAVAIVQATDRHNEKHLIASQQTGNGVSFFIILLIICTIIKLKIYKLSTGFVHIDIYFFDRPTYKCG